MKNKEEIRRPQLVVVKAVAATILAGTVLLMLPWASRSGRPADPLTALFMATSATCVTGHTVVDPGSFFSPFGQLVLLGLVQLGGLGFMTLATLCLVLLGRRMSLASELSLTTALGKEEAHQLRRLLTRTVLFTIAAEGIGALILAARLAAVHGYAPGRALYHGVFHAVSAFCNAGLALYPDSLAGWRGDWLLILAVAVLIVLGGLGFLVISECSVVRFWSRNRLTRGRLSLHARIVVRTSLALIAAGAVLVAALEWRRTLAPLPPAGRVVGALFQSVTARTAGFQVVDLAQTRATTRFVTLALMFVGGSPGSTAGGIKTTTAVVLVCAMAAMVRGRREVAVFDRTLSARVVEEALAVFLLGLAAVAALYGLLLLTEEAGLAAARFPAEGVLFEAVSAFGTVGLTTGIVPQFSALGQVLLVLGMFVGRVGPLTIALVVGLKEPREKIRFPEEDVTIG